MAQETPTPLAHLPRACDIALQDGRLCVLAADVQEDERVDDSQGDEHGPPHAVDQHARVPAGGADVAK